MGVTDAQVKRIVDDAVANVGNLDKCPPFAREVLLDFRRRTKGTTMSEFAWLIEAPGTNYLSARQLGGYEFYWTTDHLKAIRFHSQEQADLVMMAIRELNRGLFGFAETLGDAKAVEHGWHDLPRVEPA